MGVLNVHNSQFWVRDNPHGIRERGYQVHFKVWLDSWRCNGPLSATWQADCPKISGFSGNCSTGAAWNCEAEIAVQRSMGKLSVSGWTRLIQESGLEREGRCLASSVSGTESVTLFLLGLLKEHVSAVPPRTVGDLVAKPQAAVTTVAQHANACSRECRVARCRLPWNGRRALRTLLRQSW
jgi:hypothetical protein